MQFDREYGAGLNPSKQAYYTERAKDLYGSNTSVNEEHAIPWHIRHPDSRFSLVWDILQLILLLTVCWYVPLRTGFAVEVDLWSYVFWQDAFTDCYFIIDLFIQFRSAYWKRGVLIVEVEKIRSHYLRSVFPSFSAIFNRKMQKLPLFSCILIRNDGKTDQGLVFDRLSVRATVGPFLPSFSVIFNRKMPVFRAF